MKNIQQVTEIANHYKMDKTIKAKLPVSVIDFSKALFDAVLFGYNTARDDADIQTEAGIKKALEVLTADLAAMPGYTSPYREAVKRIDHAAILQQVKEEGEGK